MADKNKAKNKDSILSSFDTLSKDEKIEALDKDWQDGYKRQMEIYSGFYGRTASRFPIPAILSIATAMQTGKLLMPGSNLT